MWPRGGCCDQKLRAKSNSFLSVLVSISFSRSFRELPSFGWKNTLPVFLIPSALSQTPSFESHTHTHPVWALHVGIPLGQASASFHSAPTTTTSCAHVLPAEIPKLLLAVWTREQPCMSSCLVEMPSWTSASLTTKLKSLCCFSPPPSFPNSSSSFPHSLKGTLLPVPQVPNLVTFTSPPSPMPVLLLSSVVLPPPWLFSHLSSLYASPTAQSGSRHLSPKTMAVISFDRLSSCP